MKILKLIKWSYKSPPIELTIELGMVNKFWTCSPISCRIHDFLVSILRSTPDHTNTGVCLRKVTKLGLHTLSYVTGFASEGLKDLVCPQSAGFSSCEPYSSGATPASWCCGVRHWFTVHFHLPITGTVFLVHFSIDIAPHLLSSLSTLWSLLVWWEHLWGLSSFPFQ